MLTLDQIKEIESQVLAICGQSTSFEEITTSSAHLWDWVSQLLGEDIAKIRSEIEAHETDEHFPSPFAEERDHLLKLPILLLEKLHQKA